MPDENVAGAAARWVRASVRVVAVGLLAGLLGTSLGAARSAAQVPTGPQVPYVATRVGAEAVVALLGAPPRPIDGAPYAALPPAGGNVSDAAAATTIGGVGTVELPGVAVSGGPTDGSGGTATTAVTASRVDLFGGRVRARDIRVVASASMTGGRATIDGDVFFEALVVDGVPYPAPELNQRIDLPGIGTLVVRERSLLQFGPSSATVFVRAFRVIAADGGASGIPDGGELVIGAASAGVPDLALAPPSVLTSDLRAPSAPYVAISTFGPVDTSIRTSLVRNVRFGNDNDPDNGNGNGNDNGSGSSTGSGGTPGIAGTSGPVVVTVVVVVQTATPVPSPVRR